MTKLLTVHVTPRAKQARLEQIDPEHFRAFVTAPPTDGRANEAVRLLLADFLDIPKSRLELIRGEKSRTKTFQILR